MGDASINSSIAGGATGSSGGKKQDFSKTSTDGFSIQNAIKRSILKQNNMNSSTTTTNTSINGGLAGAAMHIKSDRNHTSLSF